MDRKKSPNFLSVASASAETPQDTVKISDIQNNWDYICKSGKENLDSELGVYATEGSSYQLFWRELSSIIGNYHKIDLLNPSFEQPKSCFEDLPPVIIDSKILTFRIRIARNINGFRFPSLMNNSERLKICDLVKNELKEIPGYFYYLNEISGNIGDKLQERRMLFTNENRFMKSAGIYRDWPQGRAIFITKDWKVCIWINEEDHIRIMSVVPYFNPQLCTSYLLPILNLLQFKLDFAYSNKLGFLTSCPTNIGTGCRASIHLQCNLNELQWFKNNGLEVRNFKGESSCLNEKIYDISLKRRFGITESQMVHHLYKILRTWIKL